MNLFISGGCKNGKSFFAQEEAKKQAEEKGVPLYYLATMIPADDEDRARIKRHLAERDGWGFTTIEQGRNICGALEKGEPEGVFLLDSVTALLSNEMFLPSGETITKEKLTAIYRAESLLQDLGFRQVRVRHHGTLARIEVLPEARGDFFDLGLMDLVNERLKEFGFLYVTLDLAGYRMGSLNEEIEE